MSLTVFEALVKYIFNLELMHWYVSYSNDGARELQRIVTNLMHWLICGGQRSFWRALVLNRFSEHWWTCGAKVRHPIFWYWFSEHWLICWGAKIILDIFGALILHFLSVLTPTTRSKFVSDRYFELLVHQVVSLSVFIITGWVRIFGECLGPVFLWFIYYSLPKF